MSDTKTLSNSDRIRVLNDNFRSTFVGHQVILSAGVAAFPADTKAYILQAVRTYRDFDTADPDDEHNFGAFKLDGDWFSWRIDQGLSESGNATDTANPTDALELTIMFMDE